MDALTAYWLLCYFKTGIFRHVCLHRGQLPGELLQQYLLVFVLALPPSACKRLSNSLIHFLHVNISGK